MPDNGASVYAVVTLNGRRYHQYPGGRRVLVGWGPNPVEAAQAAYVAGHIEVDELERRIEAALPLNAA